MPSIKLDNGVRAEDLDAAIAAENGTPAPAPKKEAPAPKAKAVKTETPKTSE
tara:strand:+ start:183 stop:338 length:156 start_codon:yes stop_codon:yes gene_type:complete